MCPDCALSTIILLEILRLIEEDWHALPYKNFDLALEAAIYVIAFCCGLWGEEVPLTDLNGVLKHWSVSCNSEPPHIVTMLLGNFKGELGENYLLYLLQLLCVQALAIKNV